MAAALCQLLADTDEGCEVEFTAACALYPLTC